VKWTNSELNFLAHVRQDHEFYDDNRASRPRATSWPSETGWWFRMARHARRSGTGDRQAHSLRERGPPRRQPRGGARPVRFRGNNAVVSLYDFRKPPVRGPAGATTNRRAIRPTVSTPPWHYGNAPIRPTSIARAARYRFRANTILHRPSPAATPLRHLPTASRTARTTVPFTLQCGPGESGHARGDAVGREAGNPYVGATLVWKYKSAYGGAPAGLVIKAGQRLYGHVDKKLVALRTWRPSPASPGQRTWTARQRADCSRQQADRRHGRRQDRMLRPGGRSTHRAPDV